MSKKIVIVEDEPAIRDNYSNALRKRGYEVKGVANRHQAIQLFESRLPDLVILDVSLEDDPEQRSHQNPTALCRGEADECSAD